MFISVIGYSYILAGFAGYSVIMLMLCMVVPCRHRRYRRIHKRGNLFDVDRSTVEGLREYNRRYKAELRRLEREMKAKLGRLVMVPREASRERYEVASVN